MAIESIVERGTQAIDASPLRAMSGSPDIIRSRGHFYSDKPPVLAALGALVYAPLYLAGLSFSTSPSQFILINAILTWTFAALGSALAVVAVRLLLQFVPLNAWLADLLALACGLTTLLLSYALTFNNHAPAAGLITLALALIARASLTQPPPTLLRRPLRRPGRYTRPPRRRHHHRDTLRLAGYPVAPHSRRLPGRMHTPSVPARPAPVPNHRLPPPRRAHPQRLRIRRLLLAHARGPVARNRPALARSGSNSSSVPRAGSPSPPPSGPASSR